MSSEAIKRLLNEKIGLNPVSVGESSVQRAITHRLDYLKLDDFAKYHKMLLEDPRELRELIEEIVVPETWFFRNNTPFDVFIDILNKQILPARSNKKKIRILSIPCSTGEEPYSLAIALHERGLNPKGVEITAIDISRQAIEKAKQAIYSDNSLRDTKGGLIDKYFTKTATGYHLQQSVRDLVRFKQGNIFIGSLSPHTGYYDVIFCRNLLIYFDAHKQQLTIEKLHRAIKQNGVLFVGHAETAIVSDKYFEPLKYAESFAYRKKSAKHTVDKQPQIVKSAESAESVPEQWQKVINKISVINQQQEKKLNNNSSLSTNGKLTASLEKELYGGRSKSFRPVEKLIDDGKLVEALNLCNKYLDQNSEAAQGYYLLARISNEMGEMTKTDSYLKKTIYLDPNHEPALILSSNLAKQRGDDSAYESFERRLFRLKNRHVK